MEENTKHVAVRIDAGDACYESYPCKHMCTIHFNDGTTEKQMMGAPTIIQKFWDILSYPDQQHFFYYAKQYGCTMRQPNVTKEDLQKYESAKQHFEELLRKDHIARINQVFQDAMDFIHHTDLVTLFTNSLKRGFAGCEVISDPLLGAMSTQQRNDLTNAIEKQFISQGLVLDGYDSLITVSTNSLGNGKLTLLPGQYVKEILPKGANLLVHETLK